jgi:hypothetical protein
MTVPPASRTRATAVPMSATVHIGTATFLGLPPATPAIGCDPSMPQPSFTRPGSYVQNSILL